MFTSARGWNYFAFRLAMMGCSLVQLLLAVLQLLVEWARHAERDDVLARTHASSVRVDMMRLQLRHALRALAGTNAPINLDKAARKHPARVVVRRAMRVETTQRT